MAGTYTTVKSLIESKADVSKMNFELVGSGKSIVEIRDGKQKFAFLTTKDIVTFFDDWDNLPEAYQNEKTLAWAKNLIISEMRK